MEGTRIAITVVIAFLGLLAAILGISAEASRKTDGIVSSCGGALTSLGISAAVILLVTQIVANVCGGCVCCCNYGRPSLEGQKTTFASACLAISWVASIVGFTLLVDGSIVNAQESDTTLYDYYGDSYTPCNDVKQGIMGGGGAMAILSTGFAIVYYLLATQVGSTSANVVIGLPVAETGPVQDNSIEFKQGPQLGPQV